MASAAFAPDASNALTADTAASGAHTSDLSMSSDRSQDPGQGSVGLSVRESHRVVPPNQERPARSQVSTAQSCEADPAGSVVRSEDGEVDPALKVNAGLPPEAERDSSASPPPAEGGADAQGGRDGLPHHNLGGKGGGGAGRGNRTQSVVSTARPPNAVLAASGPPAGATAAASFGNQASKGNGPASSKAGSPAAPIQRAHSMVSASAHRPAHGEGNGGGDEACGGSSRPPVRSVDPGRGGEPRWHGQSLVSQTGGPPAGSGGAGGGAGRAASSGGGGARRHGVSSICARTRKRGAIAAGGGGGGNEQNAGANADAGGNGAGLAAAAQPASQAGAASANASEMGGTSRGRCSPQHGAPRPSGLSNNRTPPAGAHAAAGGQGGSGSRHSSIGRGVAADAAASGPGPKAKNDAAMEEDRSDRLGRAADADAAPAPTSGRAQVADAPAEAEATSPPASASRAAIEDAPARESLPSSHLPRAAGSSAAITPDGAVVAVQAVPSRSPPVQEPAAAAQREQGAEADGSKATSAARAPALGVGDGANKPQAAMLIAPPPPPRPPEAQKSQSKPAEGSGLAGAAQQASAQQAAVREVERKADQLTLSSNPPPPPEAPVRAPAAAAEAVVVGGSDAMPSRDAEDTPLPHAAAAMLEHTPGAAMLEGKSSHVDGGECVALLCGASGHPQVPAHPPQPAVAVVVASAPEADADAEQLEGPGDPPRPADAVAQTDDGGDAAMEVDDAAEGQGRPRDDAGSAGSPGAGVAHIAGAVNRLGGLAAAALEADAARSEEGAALKHANSKDRPQAASSPERRTPPDADASEPREAAGSAHPTPGGTNDAAAAADGTAAGLLPDAAAAAPTPAAAEGELPQPAEVVWTDAEDDNPRAWVAVGRPPEEGAMDDDFPQPAVVQGDPPAGALGSAAARPRSAMMQEGRGQHGGRRGGLRGARTGPRTGDAHPHPAEAQAVGLDAEEDLMAAAPGHTHSRSVEAVSVDLASREDDHAQASEVRARRGRSNEMRSPNLPLAVGGRRSARGRGAAGGVARAVSGGVGAAAAGVRSGDPQEGAGVGAVLGARMRSMGEQHSAHEARGGVGVGDAAGAAGNGDGEASAAMENAPDEGRDQNDVEQDDPGDQNDVEQDDPGDQNDVELSPGRRGAASGAGTQDEAGDNISLLPSARSGQGGGRGDAAGDGGAQGGPPHAAERAAGTAGAKVDRPARPMQSCNNDAFAHPAGATAAAVPAPPAPAVAQGSAPPRWPTPPGVSAPIDESPVPQAAVFIKGAPSHPGSSKGAAGTDAPGRHQGGHAGVAIGHGSGNGGQRVAPNSAGGDLAALLALDRAGSGNGNGGARVDGTPHVDNAVVVENAAGHDRPSPNEAAMSCQGSMGAAPATPVPDIPPRPQAAMYIKGGSQLEDPHPALSSPPPARRGRPLAAGAARQGVGRRSSGGNDEIAGEVVEVAGSTRRAAFTPGKALWAGGSGGDAPPDAVGSMADFAAEAVGEDEPVVDGNDGWSPEADLAGGDGAGRARGGVTRGTRQASRMGAIVLGSPGASCGGQHAADKRASSTMWSDGGPVGGSGRQSRAARATGGRDAAEPSPVAEAAGSGPDRGQQAAVVAMDHSAGVPHHHHAHVHRRTHGVADESPVNAVIVGARTVEGDDVVGGEDPRGVHHGSNGGRGDGPKQARARTTSGSRGDAGPSKRQRVGSPAPPVAAPAAASHGPSHVPDPQAHPAWARASAHGGSTTSMGPARAALEAGAQPQTNHLPGASQGAAAESGGSKRGADGEGMQSGGEDMAGAIENGGGVGGGAGHAATAAALMRRSVGGVGGSRDIGKAVMRVPGVGGGVGGVGGGAAAPESSKDDSREARAVRDDDAVEVGGGGDGRVGEGGDDVAVDEDAAGGSDGEPRERARGRSASLNSHLVAASNSGTRGGRIVVHPGLLIKSHAAPAAVADLARDGDAGGRGDGNGRRRSDAPQNAVVAGGTPADVGAQPFDGASRHGDAVRPPMTTPGDGRGLQPLTMAGMLAHAAERHATGLANLLHSSPGQQVRVEAWEQRPARAGEAAGPLIIDWSRGNNGSRRVAVAPRPGADSRMGDIRGDQDDEPPPYAAPSTGAGRAGSTTACLDGADPVGGAARAARVAGPVHDEGTPHGGARGDADGDGDGEGRDGGDMGRAIHPQCAEVADGLGVGRMTDVAEGGDGPRQPTASALGRMVGARTGTGGAGDAVAARRASGPVPRPPASTDAVVAGDAPLDGAVGPAAANGDADRAGEPDNERLRWESNHAVAHGGFPPAMHSFWATLGGPLVAAAIQQGVHVPGIVPPPPPWRPGNSQAGATGAGAHGMHGAAPARQQPAATTSRASAATGSAMQGGIGQNCPEPAPTGISGGILGGAPHIVRNALQGASASGQGLSGTAAGRSRSGYYQQPGGNTPAGVSGGLEALNTLFAQRAGAGPAASGANHSGAASGGGLLLAYSLAEAVSYQLHSGGEQNQVGVLGELARQVSSHLAASRGRTPARSNLRASGEGPVSPPLPKPSGSSAAGVGVPVPVDAGSAGDDDNGGENGSGDPSPSPRIPAGAWAGSWLPASVAGAAASAERPARSGGAAGALSCRSESMQGQSSSGLPDERGSKRRRLLSSTQE